MEFKKMLQLCKKHKCIEILYFGSEKFLSCGTACMNISGIAPDWNVEDCAIALELDDEALESYMTRESYENAIYKQELLNLERSCYSLNVDGTPLQPFRLPDGCILYVDMNLLSVFKNESNKTYAFVDYNELQGVCIFIDNMFLGIAAPKKIDNYAIKRFAHSLCEGAARSAKKRFFDEGGQVSMEDFEHEEKDG